MSRIPGKTAPPGGIVLALDIGTSSTCCIGFDITGSPIPELICSREYQPRVTRDGGSELDADVLAGYALDCLAEAAQAAARSRWPVEAVGVCTFWHAFLGVDAAGRPQTPIYLWNDSRAGAQAITLRARLDEAEVHRRTGCVLHPSYLPARLLWLRESDPERFRRCACFLSPGEYLEQIWFGEARCSLSMASGTGLLDQRTLHWDGEMLAAAGITMEQLGMLTPGHEGRRGLRAGAAERLPTLRDVPFFPALGDGACNNVGSGATALERAALMIGTSAALRVIVPGDAPPAPPGLWRYLLDREHALIGGALSNGGNLHAWLRGTLRLENDRTIEAHLAAADPGGHGLVMLPFLAGERNPDYPLNATGVIVGLRLATTPLDLLQAGMEAVAFRLAAIADRLRAGQPALGGFMASGGLLNSPAWVRMLADVLGLPVTCSAVKEASARGAALMALQGIGAIPSAAGTGAPQAGTTTPDPARHAAYRRAREHHERLYALWRRSGQFSS
jgi:gluconokinase